MIQVIDQPPSQGPLREREEPGKEDEMHTLSVPDHGYVTHSVNKS